jgi:hypothetical protein
MVSAPVAVAYPSDTNNNVSNNVAGQVIGQATGPIPR